MKKIQIVEGIMQVIGKIGRFIRKCKIHKKNDLAMEVSEKRQEVHINKIDAVSTQEATLQEATLQETTLQETTLQETTLQEATLQKDKVVKLGAHAINRHVMARRMAGGVDQVGYQQGVDAVLHHKKDNKGMIIPLHRYHKFGKVHQPRKTWLHQRAPTGNNVRIDIKGTGT